MKKKFDIYKIPAPIKLWEKIVLILGIASALGMGVCLIITIIKMFIHHGN